VVIEVSREQMTLIRASGLICLASARKPVTSLTGLAPDEFAYAAEMQPQHVVAFMKALGYADLKEFAFLTSYSKKLSFKKNRKLRLFITQHRWDRYAQILQERGGVPVEFRTTGNDAGAGPQAGTVRPGMALSEVCGVLGAAGQRVEGVVVAPLRRGLLGIPQDAPPDDFDAFRWEVGRAKAVVHFYDGKVVDAQTVFRETDAAAGDPPAPVGVAAKLPGRWEADLEFSPSQIGKVKEQMKAIATQYVEQAGASATKEEMEAARKKIEERMRTMTTNVAVALTFSRDSVFASSFTTTVKVEGDEPHTNQDDMRGQWEITTETGPQVTLRLTFDHGGVEDWRLDFEGDDAFKARMPMDPPVFKTPTLRRVK